MGNPNSNNPPVRPIVVPSEVEVGSNGKVVVKDRRVLEALNAFREMDYNATSRIPFEMFRDKYLPILLRERGEIEEWVMIAGSPIRPVYLTVGDEIKYTVPALCSPINPVTPIDDGKSSLSVGTVESDRAGQRMPAHKDQMMQAYMEQNQRIITAQNPIAKDQWVELLIACGRNPADYITGDISKIATKIESTGELQLGEDEDF